MGITINAHSDTHVEIIHTNGIVDLEYDDAADYLQACRDNPEREAQHTFNALVMEDAEVHIPDFLITDDEGVQWMPVWLAHEVLRMTDEPHWVNHAELVIEDSEAFA